MSTLKNGKVRRIIALAINLQLVITTSAFAKDAKKDANWSTINDVANMATQVGGAAMQQMQQAQMQQMAQQQSQMMQQTFGLKTVDPSQVPPILSQNGCMVLEARPQYPVDKCQPPLDPNQAQSGYYTALLSVAQNNTNDLENYLTSGHERFTTQGVGCYDKALKQFTAMLNSRVEALKKLEEAIEQEEANFEKLTEQDRLNLQKGNALLTGKPADLIKDIKFEDKFNDPQCKSFISSNDIKSTGQSSGFRGIQKNLDQIIQKENPQRFKGQQNDIKRDIRRLANNLAKQAQKKKTFDIKPSSLGLKSKYLKSNNPTLTAILTEVNSDASNELKNLQKEISKTVDDKELLTMVEGINNDAIDLDNSLTVYERNKKNSCFNEYLKSNFGGISGLTQKLQDPNISKKANREADNAFKNEVVAVLQNNLLTIDQKLTQIQKLEEKKGNSRWSFTTGKSFSIQDASGNSVSVGASTRLRASNMVKIFKDNCTQRFEYQQNSKGKSPRAAITALKNYQNKFRSLQQNYTVQLRDKIIADMITCPEETTQGSGSLSCSGAFDYQKSSNFCLRTANVCAGNMLACKDKADKIVETTRTEQKTIAKAYKTKVDQFKAKLAQAFMGTNTTMEATARQLDGMYQFGSTYSIPVGLDLSLVSDKNKYLKANDGFDPALMLEDPKAYLAQAKANIKKLKASVKEQNNAILNGAKSGDKDMVASSGGVDKYKGLTGEIQKYIANYKKQKGEWESIANACNSLIDQYNQNLAKQQEEQQKSTNEQNSKVANVCKKVRAYNSHPAGFCGEASELGDEIFEIATVAGDSDAVGQLKAFDQVCDSYGSESSADDAVNPRIFANGKGIASDMTAKEFCDEYGDATKEINLACERAKRGHAFKSKCSDSKLEDYAQSQKVWYYYKEKKLIAYLDEKKCKSDRGSNCDSQLFSNFKDDEQENLLSEFGPTLMTDKDCFNATYASEKVSDAYNAIEGYIAQGKRAKQTSDMGQHINVSFCNANYDSNVGGKDFMNQLGQQTGRGLAGANVFGM